MKKLYFTKIGLILVILLGFPAIVSSFPSNFNVQIGAIHQNGVLMQNGTIQIQANLYNTASGGTSLYSQTSNYIIKNGTIDIDLKNVNEEIIRNNSNLYIGLTIASDSEASPRINISSYPYSYRASIADNIASDLNVTWNELNITQNLIVLGNIYGEIPDSFKNLNFTSLYDSRTDRYSTVNYSSEYSSTGYKLANFTSSYDNRADRFGNSNATSITLTLLDNNSIIRAGNITNWDLSAGDDWNLNNDTTAQSSREVAYWNLANYSSEYASTGYKLANFTANYDARVDRWKLSNQTARESAYFNLQNYSLAPAKNSTAWNRTSTNVVLANINDNVGIGTTSPRSLLHINNEDTTVQLKLNNSNNGRHTALDIGNTNTGTGAYSEIDFYNAGGARRGVIQYTGSSYSNERNDFVIANIVTGGDLELGGGTGGNITLSIGSSGPTNGYILLSYGSNGGVGISTTGSKPTNGVELDVEGNAECDGAGCWAVESDISLKQNITNLSKYGLADTLKIQPREYDYKDASNINNGKHSFGFIAQELKLIIPEIVYGEEGGMSIGYGGLTPILIKAIQEQQSMIENQQIQINDLKTAICKIQANNSICMVK